MQNILPIALAKDQCKNFTILQLLFLNFALVVEKGVGQHLIPATLEGTEHEH